VAEEAKGFSAELERAAPLLTFCAASNGTKPEPAPKLESAFGAASWVVEGESDPAFGAEAASSRWREANDPAPARGAA
jgi:hypothetical protein